MSGGRITVGHPVDVGSGSVFTHSTDFRIPGSIELHWLRHYSTDAVRETWLGVKWTVPYFVTLEQQDDGYILVGVHGDEVAFATSGPLRVGAVVTNFSVNMELRREADCYSVLHWHVGGKVSRFCFPAEDERRVPLDRIENLSGHRVRVQYDATGRPVFLFQELEQRAVEIDYQANDLIGEIYFSNRAGRKLLARYEYDHLRRLTASVDAMGHRKGYEYDQANRLIGEVNPLGSKFIFQYDRLGRCTRTAGDDGFMERKLRYQSAPPMTRVTDSNGAVTEYYLNPAGQVVQIVNPDGGVTTKTFDELGRLTGVVHPNGSSESHVYDDNGNRAASVDPSGAKKTIEHDDHHVPVRMVDRNGNASKLPNKHQGSLSGVDKLPPRLWNYHWNAKGLVTQARSAGGWVMNISRDKHFRWQETHDHISLIARTEFDEFGFVTRVLDEQGVPSRIAYDPTHRPIEVLRGDSDLTRYQRNAIGRVTEQIGPGNQYRTWKYDRYGNVIARTDSLGGTVELKYDREARLTSITNRIGERIDYRRNAQGQIIEEKLFDGRTQTYSYDPSGRRVEVLLSDGRTVTQTFDAAGRLLSRKASDGLVDEFEYDKEGRVIKAKNDHATVELRRDRVGRIVAEIQNGRKVSYVHDADGNRVLRSLPFSAAGSVVKRVFDKRGRLLEIADERGTCQQFRWNNLNLLIERRCPGGVIETFLYDAKGRVREQRVEAKASLTVRNHTYDADGNLAATECNLTGTIRYTYDRLNRLLQVLQGRTVVESYDYDANDAITKTHRGERQVGPGGKVLHANSREVSYGKDGAIARIRDESSTSELKHDVTGRLVEVSQSNGTVTRYEYDPFGRRTAKIIGEKRTEFLWEGWSLAAEILDRNLENVFVCAHLLPLAQWRNGRRFMPTLDTRGAVQDVFDESGQQSWTCTLDAYGNLLSQKGDVPNPFRLPGQYYDPETGLHYNFNRHYDPSLGDYTAPDPIGIEGGHHFYSYPRNPIRWSDPFGLECDGSGEPHPEDDEDGPRPRNGPAGVENEEPPEGQPRLGQQEGQDVVDAIHAALGQGSIAARNSTTTVTETEDGTVIVTNSSSVTPDMRAAISDLQEPGGPLDGRTVLVPDDARNPGYIPPAQRDLPPQGPNGTPTDAENHGEQRGIQAANYYDQHGDGNGQGHGPADTQWSRSDAGHQGQACPHCAAAQQQNNVYNPTGVDPNPQ